jgi:hypothetical protein
VSLCYERMNVDVGSTASRCFSFTQTDPLDRSAGSPWMSVYSYAANNPLVYFDPSGRREAQAVRNPVADGGPSIEQDVKGYHYEFPLGWGYWSDARLWSEFLDGVDEFPFPLEKCGVRLSAGTKCSVNAFGYSSPIKVVDVGRVSMTFESIDGHPEGSGNRVTFQVLQTDQRRPGLRALTLVADGSGPYDGPAAYRPKGRRNRASEFFTRRSWSNFASNLTGLLHQSFSRR